MDPSPQERAAILAALPDAVHEPAYRGGVASSIVEVGERVLDAAVRLGDSPTVWLRPLPSSDRRAVSLFMELLERRRGQLAHDLSGPATGVLAALETVIDYEPIPESTDRLLRDARAGMMRLTRLVDARGGPWSGEPNVVAEPLGPLLSRSVANVEATLDPVGDRLEVEVHAPPGEVVRCDARLVDGALRILVSNAWRFRSGQHVRVSVAAAVDENVLRFSVEDDGRGINGDTLANAGTLGFSTRANGAGLGLFSLRWSTRRQGSVVVLQPASRTGTRATVFVPVNTPRPDDDAASADSSDRFDMFA